MSADDLVVRLQAALRQRELIALAATQKRWVLRYFDDDHAMAATAVAVEGSGEEPAPGQVVALTLYQAPRVVDIDDQHWDENAAHIMANDPAAVLRLVQAHRDILELHQGEHECRQMHEGVYPPDWDPTWPYGAPGEKWRHASTEYFEDGQPCPTVVALARGYGVEDQ